MTLPESLPSLLRSLLFEAGACGVGIAPCLPVPESEWNLYENWISRGHHAEMGYMTNYPDVRRDPGLLLPRARSIIMTAFRYPSPADLVYEPRQVKWARYAVGDDYHDIIRRRLTQVTESLSQIISDADRESSGPEGPAFRVTVDTAPLRERYHAWRAGIGYFGLNGQLIVPGIGSSVLIGAIVTTLDLTASLPLTPSPSPACRRCGRCLAACPGHALDGRGGVDARRCLSFLTIESRAPELSEATIDHLRATGRLYGCDICQEVCPLSSPSGHTDSDLLPTPQINPRSEVIPEFAPRPALLGLSPDDIRQMDQPLFSATFARSAIKRAKLAGLKRNSR